jgi:hypothetical protein
LAQSPSEKLDIEGSGSTNLEINNTLNSISLTLGAQATAARLTAGTGNRLGFGANNTADQVTISTSGNVGIGTTSPAYKLDVSGDIRGTAYRIGSATILSGSTSVSLGSSGSTGTVSLVTTSGQGLVLNGSNVGIGTTSPAAKLDVNGGVRVADDAATASATNVGTLRYRTSGNNSYVDMCMQTGAATYAWVNIVQNNW